MLHASRNSRAGISSEGRKNGWFANRWDTVPIISSLTHSHWFVDCRKTGSWSHRQTKEQCHIGYAAECPVTVPVQDRACPPVPWRWLASTEITIVVDFINRVSEVLKARRVSRGYLGWTGWMPHAHWYGVPSLSCMFVCFHILVVIFWYLHVVACPRDVWQLFPHLSPSHLLHTAVVRNSLFLPMIHSCCQCYFMAWGKMQQEWEFKCCFSSHFAFTLRSSVRLMHEDCLCTSLVSEPRSWNAFILH